MNEVKMYKLIKEVYDGLEYLVEPVVREDIRDERGKLMEIIEYLEGNGKLSSDNPLCQQ